MQWLALWNLKYGVATVADEITNGTPENQTRRFALKKTVQVAVSAPAVALLLDAQTKAASAQVISASAAAAKHALDDFTYGNSNDDFVGTIDDAAS